MRAKRNALAMVAGVCLAIAPGAWTHCDTMDGPVVTAAKRALQQGAVTPVLPWVHQDQEADVRRVFEQALRVRQMGAEAQELADRQFFETVVRLHRMGEGAPYTGLKPAGTDIGPALRQAERALESGSVEPLVKLIAEETTRGIRERFATALEKKQGAEESVEAGRMFVQAYIEFVQYVERLHRDAAGETSAREGAGGASRDAALEP